MNTIYINNSSRKVADKLSVKNNLLSRLEDNTYINSTNWENVISNLLSTFSDNLTIAQDLFLAKTLFELEYVDALTEEEALAYDATFYICSNYQIANI